MTLAAAVFHVILLYTVSYQQERGVAIETNDTDDTTKLDVNLNSNSSEMTQSEKTLPLAYVALVVALGSTVMSFEAGLEQNATNFLQTFVNNSALQLSTATGAFMTSVLAGVFTVSRFTSIFMAMRLSTKQMLTINLIVITIGNVIVTVCANSSETGLWIGFAVLGFGFGSTWPAVFAFVEERIRVTTESVNSVANCCVQLGDG